MALMYWYVPDISYLSGCVVLIFVQKTKLNFVFLRFIFYKRYEDLQHWQFSELRLALSLREEKVFHHVALLLFWVFCTHSPITSPRLEQLFLTQAQPSG